MKFSKYIFFNKLLDNVILLRVTSDVTWIQLIYIYLYITSINIHILLNVKRPYLFLTREEKIQGKKKKTTSIDCLLLANSNAHGPCRVTTHTRIFLFFIFIKVNNFFFDTTHTWIIKWIQSRTIVRTAKTLHGPIWSIWNAIINVILGLDFGLWISLSCSKIRIYYFKFF